MNPGSSNLPYWMQIFSFIASGLIAILTIIGIIFQFTRKPILKFRLTREIFFRLTDSFAEAIFANGVLVSENKGVFVDNITFKLNKINNPIKSFILRCAFFGEKVRGLLPISDFNWHSTSPLSYIPILSPHRVSYLLVQEAYEESMKKAFVDFKNNIYEAHKLFRSTPPPTEQIIRDQKLKDLYDKVLTIVRECSSKIMELVQIEPGEYELEAKVSYKIKRFLFLGIQQSVSSKISFEIDVNIKETIRTALFSMLQTISSNIITSDNKAIISPEYSPIEVKEL